jgi:trimethylamine:corrinoid methyltransferase-like protein
MLSWPDILVGAGLLGSAMILSLEQAGPGGHFLDHPTTLNAVRSNEWYINQLGVNASFEGWEAAGKPDVMQEACEAVDRILAAHQPLPLDEEVDRELDRIRKKAADSLFKVSYEIWR